MGLLDWFRNIGGRTKAAEGAVSSGPYLTSEGWLAAGSPWNFWQLGRNPEPYASSSAMVEACVSAYSQTIAMCPGDHWRRLSNGGRERVTDSPLARIITRPNDYQSISDFLLNATRELYQTGEFFALVIRDEREQPAELHLMRSRQCVAQIATDGSIYYNLGGNQIIEQRIGGGIVVPARYVLHVRLHTPRHPLKGETPLMAAALDVAAANAALRQHIAFLDNQARPSIMLSTDKVMTAAQVMELREAWNAQTRGEGAGGTPILSGGLKPMTVSTSAQDSQLAELMKMSDEKIALAYRVPLQIFGIGGTPYASTELLMQSWIASGLGFALNHIEEAIGNVFGLAGYPNEYVEFNTKSLLRSSFRERIEGLARSTLSGIHSPDEARNEEDLPTVPGGYGAEPRVQQQVIPLSAWERGLMKGASDPAAGQPSAGAAKEQDGGDDADWSVDAIAKRLREYALH